MDSIKDVSPTEIATARLCLAAPALSHVAEVAAGARRLQALALPDNSASRHVLRKAGFIEVGDGVDVKGRKVVALLLDFET